MFQRPKGAEKALAHLRDEGHWYQAMPVNVPRFPVVDRIEPGPLGKLAQELRANAGRGADAWSHLAKAYYGQESGAAE